MINTFRQHLLSAEGNALIEEAMQDPRKMRVLEMMLEDVANTASAPGVAMVSNNEPVSPKMKQKVFGKGIWRRKPKRRSDLMEKEVRLALDLRNTNLRETHYVLHGVDTLTIDEAIGLLSHDELEMLASNLKEKIVIRAGRNTITLT